jgi:prolyl-tRNA editing enzyme YbaK/EbsC (Cys-tRNA(Pro) deacylase)
MSVEDVREYLRQFGAEDRVLEFDQSSATVELAAQAVGVSPAQIAKTMAFLMDDTAIIVVCAGDAKVWSSAFKKQFHAKPKMVPADQLMALVGHPMGGVCPFARKAGVACYLDESLRRFQRVWPAAGSENSAIGLTLDELQRFSAADGWVDVCKDWQ